MSSRASARDLSAGYVKINESDLQKTGLRGRKLIIVITCLVILWVLAVVTLIVSGIFAENGLWGHYWVTFLDFLLL